MKTRHVTITITELQARYAFLKLQRTAFCSQEETRAYRAVARTLKKALAELDQDDKG